MENAPITNKDLKDLEANILAAIAGLVTKADLAGLATKAELAEALAAQKAELQEFIRDNQTELLRGFDRFESARSVQMRKLQADLSNLDTSAELRLAMLEERVRRVEAILLGGEKPPQ